MSEDNITSEPSLLNSAPEQTTTEPTASAETTETTTTESDYSYVPEKFMAEGKPDFQKMSESYSAMEKKMGSKMAPSTPDEYQYVSDTGFEPDPIQNEEFRKEALEQDLTPHQYQWIMSKYESVVGEQAQTPEKAEGILKEEWGDSYDTNLKNASKAFEEYGEGLDISVAGNNPDVLRILANIGADLGEDSAPTSNTRASSPYSGLEVSEMMNSADYWSNTQKQQIVTDYFARNPNAKL